MTTLLLACGLSACGSSNDDTGSDRSPSAAQSETTVNPEPLEVFPQTGALKGVVASGTSVTTDPLAEGLRYTCAPELTTVNLPFVHAIDYNGTAIKYHSESWNFKGGPGINQQSVVITFEGAEFKPVSMIVHSTWMGYNDKGEPTRSYPQDDNVVILTAEMLTPAGLTMRTLNFTHGYIADVDFCLPAAS